MRNNLDSYVILINDENDSIFYGQIGKLIESDGWRENRYKVQFPVGETKMNVAEETILIYQREDVHDLERLSHNYLGTGMRNVRDLRNDYDFLLKRSFRFP